MKRRNQLVYDRQDVKEFLVRQEYRSKGCSKEELLQYISEATKALDSYDNGKLMKVAEQLQYINEEIQFKSGSAMMHIGNMMNNFTQQIGQTQNMQKVSPLISQDDKSLFNMQGMPIQSMDGLSSGMNMDRNDTQAIQFAIHSNHPKY